MNMGRGEEEKELGGGPRGPNARAVACHWDVGGRMTWEARHSFTDAARERPLEGRKETRGDGEAYFAV